MLFVLLEDGVWYLWIYYYSKILTSTVELDRYCVPIYQHCAKSCWHCYCYCCSSFPIVQTVWEDIHIAHRISTIPGCRLSKDWRNNHRGGLACDHRDTYAESSSCRSTRWKKNRDQKSHRLEKTQTITSWACLICRVISLESSANISGMLLGYQVETL